MREDQAPDLSIIIANLNQRDLLEDCLASIGDVPDAIHLEVIVVDNGSTDGSADLIERDFSWVRVIRNRNNTGFAYANNQGLAVSRGRYVMLLNNDTVVRPHALRRLVEFMDNHPDAGACGPTLLYPDGRVQRSVLGFPTPWGFLSNLLFLDRILEREPFSSQTAAFDHRRACEVDHPIGAALLVRREVVEQVGPLDERLRVHYNDVDWCYRMHKAGWRRYFVPEAVIVHHGGATVRPAEDALHLQDEIVRNMLDYYRKHYGTTGLLWVRFWTLLGLTPRYLIVAALSTFSPRNAPRQRMTRYRTLLRAAWKGNSQSVPPMWTPRDGADIRANAPS